MGRACRAAPGAEGLVPGSDDRANGPPPDGSHHLGEGGGGSSASAAMNFPPPSYSPGHGVSLASAERKPGRPALWARGVKGAERRRVWKGLLRTSYLRPPESRTKRSASQDVTVRVRFQESGN